jgi:flagellar protein FlgJ
MALATNPLETFVWGAGGTRKTPEEIARDREIAAALLAQGVDTSPVGHWTQGAARVVGALGGVLKERRANKASETNAKESQSRIAALLGGLGGGSNPTSQFPPAPGASPSVGGQPQISSQVGGGEIESYIRKAAEARGIDPNVAVAVAKSEGGLKDPFRQSDFVKNGVREQSYGPFQLYMGGGLGNKAMEAGIDPRKDWQAGIDFALDQAATGGWGPWYGAKKIGVTGMHGIGQRPPQQVASLDPAAGLPVPQMAPPVDTAMNGMAAPNPSRFAPDAQPVVPGIPGQQTMPLSPQSGLSAAQPQQAGVNPINNRPILDNGDGSYSTEESITVTDPRLNGGQPTNIPSIWGGRRTASEDEAVNEAIRSGQQFPAFGSIDEAVSAAKARSNSLAAGVPGGAQYGGIEMAGNAPQPVQMAQNGNNMQAIIEALSSPYASPQERDIAGILLQQNMQQSDPMRALQMEKMGLEMEAMRNPQKEYDFITGRDGSIFRTSKTGQLEQVYGGKPEQPTDVKVYEYAKQQGYAGTFPDWQIEQKRAGASQVNIDQKAEGAFDKKLAEKQAETFDAMATEGMAANADLAVIGELETLLGQNGGVTDGIAGWLAQRGIGGEGMSDLQAAQALINKLVPTQRQPGSGTMSDRDVELFTRSLPNLWNTPGGNQKILSVMRGLAQYKQQQGQIAQAVMTGEMTRQEATAKLRSLQNPLAEFGKPPSATTGKRLRFNPETGELE